MNLLEKHKMNWDPTFPVCMDLETQSAVNLKQVGGRAYLRDPSTRLLSAVFLIRGEYITWIPGLRAPRNYAPQVKCFIQTELPDSVRQAIDEGCTFVAHNAEGFDKPAWEMFGLPTTTWYDTMPCCRAAGLPASIDALGEYLLGEGKRDRESAALLFTAKMRGSKVIYPVGTAQLWDKFLAYNIRDVEILDAVYKATLRYGEPDVLSANTRINELGIPVDLKLAAVIRDLWVQFQKTARDEVEALTDGALKHDDVRSIPKMKSWLHKQGLAIPSLERKQLEALIEDPNSFFGDTDDPVVQKVLAVLYARQHASRATVGKVTRVFTAADSDSRIRGAHVAYGAHTGRFTSREFQSHNMARGMSKLDVEGLIRGYHETGTITLDQIRIAAEKSREPWQLADPTGDALATLMRPIVRGDKPLAILDYSRIEAVCVAWISGAENMLSIYRDPSKCIYCEQSTAVYGRPITKKNKYERGLGKIMILGLGYGMGAKKFAVACKWSKPSVNLEAIGVTAEECVKVFRETYPDVPATWRAYDRAAHLAIDGYIIRQNKCTFSRDGRWLIITLPSGRELRYRNARVELCVPKWGGNKRPTLLYDGRAPGKVLYGGLLMENISQAICRDLLATALVRIPGICLHVHDEIVVEGGDLKQLACTMSTPPDWAQGFPVRVEGFTCPHYTKSPWSDSETVDAMNGEIL